MRRGYLRCHLETQLLQLQGAARLLLVLLLVLSCSSHFLPAGLLVLPRTTPMLPLRMAVLVLSQGSKQQELLLFVPVLRPVLYGTRMRDPPDDWFSSVYRAIVAPRERLAPKHLPEAAKLLSKGFRSANLLPKDCRCCCGSSIPAALPQRGEAPGLHSATAA